MVQVEIQQAGTQLSRLVEQAERGEEVIIQRGGKPVARIIGLSQPTSLRQPGSMRGQLTVPDDFDAPLDPAVLAVFEDEK